MDISTVSIEIEGDYLSSFIYSGVLFLVDMDFKLNSYSWDRVVNLALGNKFRIGNSDLRKYLLNSSRNKIKEKFNGRRYFITKRDLQKANERSIYIGVWPSDINLYRNTIYIASEAGVNTIHIKWEMGNLTEYKSNVKIWDCPSFRISPNSFYRLAIASGQEGLVTVIPQKKYVEDKDVKVRVKSVCTDCDWYKNRLVANTVGGVSVLDFEPIPDIKDYENHIEEYWRIVNQVKLEDPLQGNIKKIDNKTVVNSWFGGNKEFFLTEDMTIAFRTLNPDQQNNKTLMYQIEEDSIVTARTATFGTVVETKDTLKLIGQENGFHTLDNDFVTWRVFPRSKYYANQIHIIKDKSIVISAIDPKNDNLEASFGFSLGDVELDKEL
ncbi:hypothetical protein QCB45_09750 [Thiomicrorhabdus sp. ZW0627]|uniref:hypothetical protein n=1 Tax=Thiomicrorhabdus sp. ZW0627 TaxID=3039774 RepID=UPI002436953F|nr:hypothetical protein [Thiomicrorhabdus sp. ZW0627]MDG6774617.1 hypothetical protein [Thiomicrorhabdus sp. ZW0627]